MGTDSKQPAFRQVAIHEIVLYGKDSSSASSPAPEGYRLDAAMASPTSKLRHGHGLLLRPILSRNAWPKIRPKPRRAITSEEHRRIVIAESDPERRNYYQMLWFSGGAQTNVAHLHSDRIDKAAVTICYQRKKMRSRNRGHCRVPIGEEIQTLLDQLPAEGWFFPTIRLENSGRRSSKFKRLCLRLGINDITLHSYRYALAERAFWSGMPEAEAMVYLGHSRRARHHAYAKNAPTIALPLSYYEKRKAGALGAVREKDVGV